MDPPIDVPPADARRANRAGAVASADELAATFEAARAASLDARLARGIGGPGHGEITPADAAVPSHRARSWPPPDLGARLVELCQHAHRALPALAIDDRELVFAIGSRAPVEVAARGPDEASAGLDAYLERCRPADLAVALAAARGLEPAIAHVERAYRLTIDSMCRRFASASRTAEDLKQILRDNLFVSEEGKSPKIADYAGQGDLESWLRVTAVRIFLGLGKCEDRVPADHVPAALAGRGLPVADEALAGRGALAGRDVRADAREAVTLAMQAAARQLAPGDRHLLRQHVVAGLSIDQLAAVLGIPRATAARRITRARELLATGTRRELAHRLASDPTLDPSELDDVIGLVMRRLEMSPTPRAGEPT